MRGVAALAVAALVALASVAGGVTATTAAPARGGQSSATVDGGLLQQNNTTESPPTAEISVPDTVQVGERVVLDGSNSGDPDGSIESYEWTTEYGGRWTGETAAHRFPRPGEVTVTLTVTDDDDHTDTATVTVTVTEQTDDGDLDAALSLGKQTVAEGEIFAMNASASTTNGDVVGYWYDIDDDDQFERKNEPDSVYTCTDEAGTYQVSVWVVEVGRVDHATATIEVTANESYDGSGCYAASGGSGNHGDSGDQGDAGGQADSGSGSTASTTASYDPATSEIDVDRSGTSVSVDADHVPADRDVTVALSTPPNASVDFGDLQVDLRSENTFRLDANTAATAPGDAAVPSVATAGFQPVGYLTVETRNLESWAASGGNLTFALDGERLLAANATPADVTLYRWHNGSWNAVGTTVADWNATRNVSANGTYEFHAALTSFSTFAVGVEQPAIAVTDLTLHERNLSVGDTAEFTAVVRNRGAADGTATVTFRVGNTVRNRTVSVAANETAQVTFVRRLADSGAHTASIGNKSVSFQVQSVDTTTSTPDDDTADDSTTDDSPSTTTDETTTRSTTPPTTTGPGQPGFGVAAALVALAAAALLARRQ